MKSPVTILVAIIVILAATLGYVAGKQGFNLNNPLASPSPSALVSTTPTPTLTPSPTPTPTPSPSTQTINAGGVMSFPNYSITIPADWKYSKESLTKDDQKLTLEKSPYKIVIQQGGFGGAMCLYPGDAGSEGPAGRYTAYVEIQTQSGDLLRRSTPENGKGFGICELSKYGWGAPTKYGHIGLTVPNEVQEADLKIIDEILSSLKKI